jgi:hypothetical protein
MHGVTHTEFSVYLEQRPGELAGLLDACQAAGVDIVSMITTEHAERAVVRLIGWPVESLRHVCESLVESGHGPVVESEVVSVEVAHRPGAVRDIAAHLARHRVNVRYCYLTPGSERLPVSCVFRFDDPAAARSAFETLDLPGARVPRTGGTNAA